MSEQFIIKGPDSLEPLPAISLGEMIFNTLLENRPHEDVIIDVVTGESVTNKQLLTQTYKIAQTLKTCGLKQNDIIAVCSENSVQFLQPVIAALYNGIVTTLLNFDYSSGELLHAVSLSQPKIVFCSQNCAKKILEIKSQAPYIKKIVVLNSNQNSNGLESLQNFIGNQSTFNITQDNIPLRNMDVKDQVAVILFSSGTTGLPKGVMITHQNIQVRCLQVRDPRVHHQIPNETVASFLPLFHASGFMMTVGDLAASKKIALISKFDEKLYLKTLETYKVKILYTVPTIAFFLSKTPLLDEYDLSSAHELLCGSAALKKETEELLKKKLKLKSIRQVYGMTELTLMGMIVPLGDYNPGSVGKVTPLMAAKVADVETGKPLGPNENGEICFKGPLVMKGYYRNEEATANTIKDGWLHTGDLGYYDENKYFYVVDRLKELIKYKGFQVPPAEIEKLLMTHPGIQDAAVVGVPDERTGELPLALVVKMPNITLTEKEVQAFVAKHVSPQKRLHGGVKFVTSLPKTSIVKLVRRELLKLVQNHKAKL